MKTVQPLLKPIFLILILSVVSIQTTLSQSAEWINNNNTYRISTPFSGQPFIQRTLTFDFPTTANSAHPDFLTTISANWGHLRFNTGSTERMRIMSTTGFVGINSTAPQHHLHIHGTTDFTSTLIPIDPGGGGSTMGNGEGEVNHAIWLDSTSGRMGEYKPICNYRCSNFSR